MIKKGSITVFLSLVGLLIFALLGTLVETARFGVCENRASRTLQTSAEGLLTEYSRPLQKQYGLFFLEQRGTPYETVISKYAGTSMETSKGKMDLLMGTFREIAVTEKFCAGDNGGEAIGNQITAYMEKTLAKKALEKYKKKKEVMQTSEKEAEKMDELVKEQEETAKLYKTLSSLIKLVDGISVSNGNISCEDNFVKSFCCKKEPEGIDYGITEISVWKKMKKNLDDSTLYWKNCFSKEFLKKLNKVIEVTEQAVKEGEKLKKEYDSIEVKIDRKNENPTNERIKEVINNLSVLDGNLFVLNETKTLLSDYEKKSAGEKEKKDVIITKFKKIWKDYNTSRIVFDYTGVTEKGGADDPSENLSKAWNGGILSLVMTKEELGKLSKKSVSHADYYADYYDMVSEKKQDETERMDAFVEKGESSFSGLVADGATVSWEKFCFLSYMQEKFGHYKML